MPLFMICEMATSKIIFDYTTLETIFLSTVLQYFNQLIALITIHIPRNLAN